MENLGKLKIGENIICKELTKMFGTFKMAESFSDLKNHAEVGLGLVKSEQNP